MKTKLFPEILHFLIASFYIAFPAASPVFAQVNQMSYIIKPGYHRPILSNGEDLVASIDYNEMTGEIDSFAFEIPLNSFIYNFQSRRGLELIGIANSHPYMIFQSEKIEKKRKI